MHAVYHKITDIAIFNCRGNNIWQTCTDQRLLSAHLISKGDAGSEAIIRSTQEMLLHRYGINHTTLQFLPAGVMEHCNHCNWGKMDV